MNRHQRLSVRRYKREFLSHKAFYIGLIIFTALVQSYWIGRFITGFMFGYLGMMIIVMNISKLKRIFK